MKRILAKTIAAMLGLILLCSCNNSKAPKENENKSGQGTVKLQMRLTESFDPLASEKESVRDVLSLCYEPLFRINGEIAPEGVLAKSCKISDDCMSAIISLKDSVKWHDEKAFTAGDVVYTIERIKEMPDSVYSFCVAPIESAEAIDAGTVRLSFNRPYARIAYSLYFPIVPSHASGLDSKIMGTGPYMMDDYIIASQLILKSFELWHAGQAKNNRVEISLIRDKNTAETAFNTGIIDAITGNSIDLKNYALKSGERSARYPSSSYEFLAFNNISGIFKSRQMRSAVSLAIDREAISKDIYTGLAVAANAPLHPQAAVAAPSPVFAEYNKEVAFETFFYEGYSLNKETGMLTNEKGETISFTILVNNDNSYRVSCAELIASQLREAGIDVKVRSEEFSVYTDLILKKNFDAYIGGTKLGNLYDYEFLFSKQGSLNNYGYEGEDMELALMEIAASPTDDSLENAVKNFEEVFMREQPICGIVYLSDVLVASDLIRGSLLPSPGFPYAGLSGWSIKK